MSNTLISTSVTTVYANNDRLLCPPRHLFHEAPVALAPNCFPSDSYQPAVPSGPCLPSLPPDPNPPHDGINPENIQVGNVGQLLIGGIVGNRHHVEFADAIGNLKTNGFSLAGLKTLGSASLKAGGLSAGITAAVSSFQNIGAAFQGKISGKEAVSNVTSDTVGGMLTGTTAGIGAGAATLALRSFGVSGLALSIGAAAAGALGGLGGSKLYEATGLRNRVFKAAQAFLS